PKSSMNNYNQFKTTVLQPPIESKQYVSIVYNERLEERGISASIGTVGDSYDNTMAENVNGPHKNELIHRRTWADVVEVEIATFKWVNWWNESRLHQSLGYRTPADVEA
ncbi:integrase core domain-containing protein, partial [Corynebacterium diphtheriae]